MSAIVLGPNTLSKTRAIFPSSSGCGSPWQNNKIALAMYCPTPGNDSISERPRGNLPFRLAISRARDLIEDARRRHNPIGCNRFSSSLIVTRSSFFQDDNSRVNVGKNFATVSALVLCKRISAIMYWYLLMEEFLQGNFLPYLSNHSSKPALNFLTFLGEGKPEGFGRGFSFTC